VRIVRTTEIERMTKVIAGGNLRGGIAVDFLLRKKIYESLSLSSIF